MTLCVSVGNPGSVSQCLAVSGNSCESLLRVCHRVYVCAASIKNMLLPKVVLTVFNREGITRCRGFPPQSKNKVNFLVFIYFCVWILGFS